MEKLRIEKEDIYQIEVNDNGEYIEFDLLDLELPEKIVRASLDMQVQLEEYNKRREEIYQKYKDDTVNLVLEDSKCEKEYCNKLREIFDSFLGEGACQKIFGDTNRFAMFDKLMETLEKDHFPKMKMNVTKAKQKLADRYLPKEKNVM